MPPAHTQITKYIQIQLNGNLVTDSTGMANILVKQFQSVFCKVSGLANECHLTFTGNSIPSVPDLIVTVKGVEKLL